ncbi:MAG: hypothetical protein ACKO04_09335 [Actinomycetes bacterium]
MTTISHVHPVTLGFMPEAQVIDDPDHPGLRRAGPRAGAPYGNERVERHDCPATDLDQHDRGDLDLRGAGFDTVDLSGLHELQRHCADARRAGRITDEQAAGIRAALDGAVLPVAHGPALQVLHVADEGLFMRTAGPDGLSLVGPRSVGMNEHGQATSIHIDQDVYGTPLVQVMDGRAPELFVHDSPDGHNHDADLMLVNLWIPLQQVVQPLVLADGRTLDRRRDQLRYGLPTGSFLERDGDQVINDIWSLLHDEAQQWFFRSEMDHRRGYVFNTLSTPHGAGTLPGEEVARRCWLALEAVEAAAAAGDPVGVSDAAMSAGDQDLPTTKVALRSAVEAMAALLDEARRDPVALCAPATGAWAAGAALGRWAAAAQAVRRAVVRYSLELRMVVSGTVREESSE